MVMDFQVTFDSTSPRTLAAFWSSALGYGPEDPPDGFASWDEWFKSVGIPEEERDGRARIVDPEGRRPRICFLRVPEGKAVKNRVHLDLDASDGPTAPLERRKEQVDAAVERMLALGATRFAIYEDPHHYHVTMQDPEGNEFCVR